MSKRLSIFFMTAIVALTLLGSAVLLPALHNPTPGHSTESTGRQPQWSGQRVATPVQPIVQRTADETDGGTDKIIDYTFVFTGNDEVAGD